MQPIDATKMVLVFPLDERKEEMAAIPLTLRMGWNNSSSIFCTATETFIDLVNVALSCNQPSRKHKLYNRAEVVFKPELRPLHPELDGLSRDPYFRCSNANTTDYVDIFVVDFFRYIPGDLAYVAPHL